MVGLGRFELPASRLSGARSNQLSYRPLKLKADILIFQINYLMIVSRALQLERKQIL